MAPNPESVKDKIWSLLSTSRVTDVKRVGAAFCASKDGLLVATIFGVCPRTQLENENIVVGATDANGRIWRVELVDKFTEFGLIFYQVVKDNPEHEFGFVNIESINEGESSSADVFTYLNYGRLTYSTLSAYKGYPSPPTDLIFPDNVSNLTVKHLGKKEKSELYFARMEKRPLYRMVENIFNLDKCDVNAKNAVIPEAAQLYTKLPFLQFSGLEVDTYKGSSGCSVFSMEDNKLIGLILFNINSSCFVLPLSVVRHCFTKYKENVERTRLSGGGGGGGASGSGRGIGGGLTW